MKNIKLGVIIFLLSACATYDFNLTSFRKNKSDAEYDYYTFKAFADSVYPYDSSEAEKTRMDWLKRWLIQNNVNSTSHEIMHKEIYNKHGNIKDIYYEIRIKRK